MKAILAACLILFALHDASAGPLRERLAERRAQQQEELDADSARTPVKVPAGVQVLRDIPYGPDPRQQFDVYRLERQVGQDNAPVIFMVHGGGWRNGDKEMGRVVENKVARWVPKGFIFVSVNYRMLPQTPPLQQAEDVALALATAQRMAAGWGGDASRFILMGHSAGAHLVALLSANPEKAFLAGARPWRGSVLLDSAAFDITQIMQGRHMRLYDQAFGRDPAVWRAASPVYALTAKAPPMLAVCSSRRSDSCAQADGFIAKAGSLGVRAEKLEEDLSHREINETLGLDGPYTAAVERFMATLDIDVRRLLAR
ncbi:alpha/beta hydrolase [Oxalobacteraceae bacterium OM1]|nr:alpha/beta hydrolase [Oxalobacteraceae bacterium OM1]